MVGWTASQGVVDGWYSPVKNVFHRFGLLLLGVLLVCAISKIGELYHSGFRTEYGWSLNAFGVNEGSFFLLYTVFGLFAVVLFSSAVRDSLERMLSRFGSSSVNQLRMAICLAAAAFLAAVLFRFSVFLEAPMTDDENAYTYAARIIASGQLTLQGYPETLRPFLSNQFIIMEDRVFTQYFPGFPLVLALPLHLGVEWIVNPFAAAIGILGTYYLGRDLAKCEWTGLLAAMFLFISPTYMLTAGTLFSHPVAAAWAAWGLFMVWRARQSNSRSAAIIGAICLGMLLVTRPLSGAVCGIAAAWMLLASDLSWRERLALLAPAALVGLAFCFGLLVYNALTTGNPLVTGYSYWAQKVPTRLPGFSLEQFSSGRWLQLLAFPLLRFNSWMLGWPLSLFLIPFVPKGPLRFFGLLVVLGIWFAHLPWSATGVNLTGAVHYFEAMPMLTILSAAGAMALIRHVDRSRSVLAVNAVVFSTILSLFVFYPWATKNLHRLASYNIAPYVMADARVQPPAIVFATYTIHRYDLQRRRPETWTYYRKNNSAALDDDVLWFNDLGHRNTAAMKLFPDRRYYRLVSLLSKDGRTLLDMVEVTEEDLVEGAIQPSNDEESEPSIPATIDAVPTATSKDQ